MSGVNLPTVPPNLKAIQHYLKTAVEHDKRDPVVAYYCTYFRTFYSTKSALFNLFSGSMKSLFSESSVTFILKN